MQQILVQPDKKILVAGTFYSTNGAPLTNLERLNADGSLDTGFHAETGFEDYSYGVNLAEDGKIIVLSGRPPWVRRLNADGSLDSTFPDFHLTGFQRLSTGATLTVYHVSVKSIGAVAYVYGNFFFINGARAYGLGRILLDVPLRTGMDIQTDETRGYSYYSYLQPVGESDGSLTAKVRRLGQTTALPPSLGPRAMAPPRRARIISLPAAH